jgi:hypothetical protein
VDDNVATGNHFRGVPGALSACYDFKQILRFYFPTHMS